MESFNGGKKLTFLEPCVDGINSNDGNNFIDSLGLGGQTHTFGAFLDLLPINNSRLCLVLGCFRNVLGTFYKGVFKNHSQNVPKTGIVFIGSLENFSFSQNLKDQKLRVWQFYD